MNKYIINKEKMLQIKKALEKPDAFECEDCFCGYFYFQLELDLYISIHRSCPKSYSTPEEMHWKLHEVSLIKNKRYDENTNSTSFEPEKDIELEESQMNKIFIWAKKRCAKDYGSDEYGNGCAEKEIHYPAVYSHFLHNTNGVINNHIFVTMEVSHPSENYYKGLENAIINLNPLLTVKLVEEQKKIIIYEENGRYYHNQKESLDELIIYKSLNDNQIFAKSIDLFSAEVNKEDYPDSEQYYEFELVE